MEAKAKEDGEFVGLPVVESASEAEEEEAAAAEFGSKAVDEIARRRRGVWQGACRQPARQEGRYELLGIDRTATDADVKRAYKELAIALHPDRNPTASDEEKEQMDVQFKDGEARRCYPTRRKRRYFACRIAERRWRRRRYPT